MTEQLRYRIDSRLKKKAERVLDELGCDPSAAISMFYAQIVRARALPFRPSEFPALDEYGATVEEAQRRGSKGVKTSSAAQLVER
jgi:addiction module RelB/DinJ family antitoxin